MPGYIVNGQPAASVTQIVGSFKPSIDGLMSWAAGFGSKQEFKRRRYEGADLGRAVHARIEAHLRRVQLAELDLPKDQEAALDNCWQAFCGFAAEHFPPIRELVGIEQEMVHEEKLYGGTADLIVRTDRGVDLWDWKTSKSYDPERQGDAYRSQRRAYWLQLAAYGELLAQQGLAADYGLIVALGKDTARPTVFEFDKEELERGRVIFDHLRFVYQSLQHQEKTL